MIYLVAFDLDGTLSQSDRFLPRSYRLAAQKLGAAQPPEETLRNMIGGSYTDNRRLMEPYLPPEQYDLFSQYTREFAVELSQGCAYPEIVDCLEALKGMGCLPVLCSNGLSDYVEGILQAEGLRSQFGQLLYGQRGWNKTQVLAYLMEAYHAGCTVMVGDRHFDLEAARGNGVPFIGCGYGLFPQEIQTADRVVASPAQIPQAVRELLEL